MKTMNLGVYQGEPITGDIEATLQLMEEVIAQARRRGVQLLVFPELFVTGYTPSMWKTFPTIVDENRWKERLTIASKDSGIWLIFGHPSYGSMEDVHQYTVSGNDATPSLWDAASLVSPNGVVGTYRKAHLYGDEFKTFAPGADFPVWETPFGKIAVQLCYDIEFPEAARIAALRGAEILVNPANNMTPFATHHRCFTMARAMENAMFVATVNRIGWEQNIDFCGGSCVAHPDGTLLLDSNREQELFVVSLSIMDRALLSPSVQYLDKRKPSIYSDLTATDHVRD